jgi:hypothetical protein
LRLHRRSAGSDADLEFKAKGAGRK